MITKHAVLPQRVRQLPRQGFSWIDRRFLRIHAKRLSSEAIFLYLFLAAVSDRLGLSFYSDATVAALLGLDAHAIARAREQLIAHDLVAYRYPLSQVLSLPHDMPVPSTAIPQLYDADQ